MAIRYFFFISIISILVFNGCHCKDNEPLPIDVEKNAFDFFPNNKEWIYEVYRTDYTVRPPVSKYAYDDTLYFEKDTNIRKDTIYKLLFKSFKFKKAHKFQEFVIGTFIGVGEQEVMRIARYSTALELFALDNIKESGANINYKFNALPIDNRLETSYYSPFQQNYNTILGNFKIINANASYNSYNSTEYLIYQHTFKFAEKVGPVEYTFDFKERNTTLGIDSFYTAYYKIKKIIN